MQTLMKSLLCIALSFICVFTCVGYASVSSSNLSVRGYASAEPDLPDIYITDITPNTSAGITVKSTSGTLMSAQVTGGGTATFTVTVKNISSVIYVYDRVIEGKEVALDGVYAGDEITYRVIGLSPSDEVAPNGGIRSFQVEITVPQNVTAEQYILKFNFVEKFATPGEEEFPEDMPSEEISLAQRLSDILNNKYKTDTVTNSRDYLINETIQVRWEENAPPYVGSMDKNYEEQIDELFGDVMKDTNLSFILKNQDLNDDWLGEIALYSTTDVLDSTEQWGGVGVVCVYVTVFTPILDVPTWTVTGYTMACEAVRGYCYEVRYGAEDLTPSFTTDEWRTDVGYVDRWENNAPYLEPIPNDALSADGTKLYKYDFDSYNLYYGDKLTAPYGQTIKEWLKGKIPPAY